MDQQKGHTLAVRKLPRRVLIVIEGAPEGAGVLRQTLWRWRQQDKIPVGRLFRGRQVLFTQSELDAIKSFAHRIEPVQGPDPAQVSLFPFGAK